MGGRIGAIAFARKLVILFFIKAAKYTDSSSSVASSNWKQSEVLPIITSRLRLYSLRYQFLIEKENRLLLSNGSSGDITPDNSIFPLCGAVAVWKR